MAIKTQGIVRSISISLILLAILSSFGCKDGSSPGAVANDSPTEAYKRLFTAVKSKDTNAIKNEMSKQSIELVGSIAAMQKKPIEDVYGNGLTSTLHSETLPEIRDERVSGNMGAIEVYNSTGHKWDDVPFILEDGRWKLALGDAYNGKFNSPGKGRDQKEKEAANILNNNLNRVASGTNSNIRTAPANNRPMVRPSTSTGPK